MLLGKGLGQDPNSIKLPPQVYVPYGFWQREGRHRGSAFFRSTTALSK